MNNVFFENLKKYRLAKGLTQEQTAEQLHVNAQTVSRWECGTTLPDVLTLPRLAQLYGVTVDDFYKKNAVGYENYAQRLSAVFENSHDPADFMCCRAEFQKLIRSGTLSTADKWIYGWIHFCMMNICKDTALDWFEKAVADDPSLDPQAHHIACMQRINLYFRLKRGEEIIAEYTEKVQNAPNDPRQTDYLIVTLIWAERFEEACDLFRTAKEKFPDYWQLFIHGGDIFKKLGLYDEAMECYETAGRIGTAFCDELYCMASLSEDRGDHENAEKYYLQIAQILGDRGCDVEAEAARKNAAEAAAHAKSH